MLTAEQVARRVVRELAAGARLQTRDSIPCDLNSTVESQLGSGAQITSFGSDSHLRAISSLGVFDIGPHAWTLREVPPGVSAAEVQSRIGITLLCGPDLIDVPIDL